MTGVGFFSSFRLDVFSFWLDLRALTRFLTPLVGLPLVQYVEQISVDCFLVWTDLRREEEAKAAFWQTITRWK